MPRRYHSPSSIALGQRCKHLWALTYIDGIRDPEVAWVPELERPLWDHGEGCYVLPDGVRVTAQQRGSALGKCLHETAERYLDPSRGEPDWHWFPGRVLHSGKHHLPRPDKIGFLSIEAEIGTVPLERNPNPEREGAPTVAIEIAGVRWAGRRDLLAFAPDEWRRLRVNAPDGLAVVDYKSTSDISKHALTPAELTVDGQGNIYAIDLCEELGLRSVPGRWIYFESKRVRRSIAVDTVFELSRAYDTIGPLADLARELDQLTCSADAEKNPDACSDFGAPDRINCRRHVVNGGTCNARRRLGPLVQIRTSKEENTMALTAEQKAKFEAKKLAAKAAAEGGGDAGAETKGRTDDDASEGEGETEAADPKPAASAPAKPKPAAAKAPAVTGAGALLVLVKELEQHEKAAEGVRAKIRSAVG